MKKETDMKKKMKRYIAILMSLVMMLSFVGCTGEDDGHFGLTITQTDIPKLAGINPSQAAQSPSQPDTTEQPGSTEQPGTTEQPGADNTAASFDSSYIGRSDGHKLEDKYSDEGVDLNSAEAKAEQQKFSEFEDKKFKDMVTGDSITLHYTLIHPENYGVTAPKTPSYGDLDITEEAVEATINENKKGLKELKSIDRSLLTKNQKLEYDMLLKEYEFALDSTRYTYMTEPFAYTSGIQSNLPITLSEYKLYTVNDVDTYLELVKQTRSYVDVLLEFEEIRREKGYFMSSACADEVVRQCEEFIANPETNLLIETFDDHITAVEGLDEKQINTYRESHRQAVLDYVIPAYQDIIEYFKAHRTDGKNDKGLCYNEYGRNYYKNLLYKDACLGLTPEEVIERLDQGIQDAMNTLITYAQSDYTAYSEYTGDQSRYKELDVMETLDFFRTAYADRFPDMPDVSYSAQNVHESLKDIVSPAFYITPALDDIAHNYIYLNLQENTNELWSTLAHEGIAGHMYQFCYYLNTKPQPIRAVMDYKGYSEGWATYIECMSFGYYKDFKYPEYVAFETLNHQLNLLVSARMEIGVNYEGWSKEELSSWLTQQGFSGNDIDKTYTYLIAEPVNYQMYIMGWLSFEDIKAYAREKLGSAFDEKEFHKVVLEAGPTPFPILKDWVDSWIMEKLG